MIKCDTLVTLTYRWTKDELVLHKFVTITNRSREPWNRLHGVRLGIRRRFSAHVLPGSEPMKTCLHVNNRSAP